MVVTVAGESAHNSSPAADTTAPDSSFESLAAAAKNLVLLAVPPHLDNPGTKLALLGARVLDGSLAKIYREMARLLHPDKPEGCPEFCLAFQTLGKLYDSCLKVTAVDIKRNRFCTWRFSEEQEF